MARTIIWTSPLGAVKRIRVGGNRRRPLASAHAISREAFDTFCEHQRARVARSLQRAYERILESRNDGMDRRMRLTETIMERRG